MAHDRISVVVLGNGDSLKKAVTTHILGQDLSQVSRKLDPLQNEIYENDTHEVTCTTDVNNSCEAIKELFTFIKNPDKCLLVVQGEFSTDEVWKKIERLSMATGKLTKEFTVVPVSYRQNYAFKLYSMGQIFGGKRKPAEDRPQTKKRPPVPPKSNVSTGDIYNTEKVTDIKKSSKRKLPGNKVNLVLLGLAGTGKSASGNTIVGQKSFQSNLSSQPVTTECQMGETQINGTCVRVIDTPDIFDDEMDQSLKDQHVATCKLLCQAEPCVYLLVMQVSRFTDGEKDIMTKLEKLFGNRAREQTLILFTHGDDLQHDDKSVDEFFKNCQPNLRKIIRECGSRCVVFENKAKNSQQVQKLIQTVEGMLPNHQK